MTLEQEIQRRRTFAIVSHPDAGKTTLTEKLLLYGGAVQLAGSVTARKKERATVSDWMEIERKRGISVSSTVLNFDYNGYRINLLDTPGHNDFSEDTYRVLNAVDSVVMVIDGGKGIEKQTKKLFEVCRKRSIPVFTFVNKMDRPALDTLALLDEIESVLQIRAWPVNWPLGSGVDFKGVWDRNSRLAHLFERTVAGAKRAPVTTRGFDDPLLKDLLGANHEIIGEDISLVEHSMPALDVESIGRGETTPVYFGSAANNFGVELMLNGYLEHSPAPAPRRSFGSNDTTPVQINPENPNFSAFVFKIQANLDPRHRDRMAFMRIVSGKFTRDMFAIHVQSGKKLRLSNSSAVFGRERVSIDEAYPGDIIGVVGNNSFSIGDTVSEDPTISYSEIPRFPPECFSFIHNPVPSNYKRFASGLEQLIQEGLVHSFEVEGGGRSPLLAAVGPLQFDLVHYRLEAEYGAASRIEPSPWSVCSWVVGNIDRELQLPYGAERARDRTGNLVLLFTGERQRDFFRDKHAGIVLNDYPL
ncbi:MAG: peptide chain release factor 3 [Chitinispirillaceae bacterium]|jgi:peptide chain release factor 3|nr:peptide chain release factor 3 [Chitinispirillaceae bacterium]